MVQSFNSYSELSISSNFSFLRGASHPEEFVATAACFGYRAIALTDCNTLAGIVRAHQAAKEVGLQFIVGTRLILNLSSPPPDTPQPFERLISPPNYTIKGLPDSLSLLVFPSDRKSYGNLCSLLTKGNRRTKKGDCLLYYEDFLKLQNNLLAVILPDPTWKALELEQVCKLCLDTYHNKELLSLALVRNYTNRNKDSVASVIEAANKFKLSLLASNDVYYHAPERRPLQDILTCIRLGTSIQQAGLKLFQNGERYLKPVSEMHRLFKDTPSAISRTLELSERLSGFSLDELKYEYPDEVCPEGKSPLQYLSDLSWQGARERYPSGVPAKVAQLIQSELSLIHELNYEKYFLTCYDIVKFARGKGILCQGRGAAANSAVCFCLGITSVDPAKIDLLFARFISKERNEPPDIDIDFEHERREEVIQYIYDKYGRHHAGLTGEVISYRHRSALRDVGKALGISLEAVDKLAKSDHRWTKHAISDTDLKEIGLEINNYTVQNLFKLTDELLGFPRHLSQHVGGFIICQKPLSETVPILNAAMEDRTIIEWDKDDIDVLGMLKIDILALGMLTCIRKALDAVNSRRVAENKSKLELFSIPAEDPAVYDMLCEADTIGVFQIESRAQMSMLPRLKPRCFYDLVIEVAIVRPGPIQGNMVHPFLKRRNGLEKVEYPDNRVREILGKTLGVPIFQEQAMRLAIVLAQFTPGEAEKLRRSMAAWKKDKGAIAAFRDKIVNGMLKNGYSLEFAENCVNQLKGFSEYGFPESHAASFALLVYASAWLKKYYPAEFATALLNSQPMGFYAPAQIIKDAQNHGVEVLPVDINFSQWDTTLVFRDSSTSPSIRLGMHIVKGLQQEQANLIFICRNTGHGGFKSPLELWNFCQNKHPLSKNTLLTLARADAFSSMGLSQRDAIWNIKALPAKILPLDNLIQEKPSAPPQLPQLSRQQSMFQDYELTGLSLKGHPIQFLRSELDPKGVLTAISLRRNLKLLKGKTVLFAGVVLFRQRPPTAKGVVFLTLEDETGIVNLIIRPQLFDKFQKMILSSSCLLAQGIVEFVGNQPYLNVVDLKDNETLATLHVHDIKSTCYHF